MRWRSVAIFLAGLMAVPVLTAGAKATPICDRLSAQLASLPKTSGSTANYRRYATAVKKQEAQMKQVRGDMKRYGCSGSIIVFGGRTGSICKKLKTADAKMQANPRALDRKRDGYQNAKSSKAERSKIESALHANGCFDKPARKVISVSADPATTSPARIKSVIIPDGSKSITILDQSGGANGTPYQHGGTGQIVVERRSGYGGNLRTVCVRSCDGYFFPISSAASSADFGRDQRTCQMMCPGTQTELFYNSVDGESEDMISVATNRPYTEMPNAFYYRSAQNQGRDKSCSCNMAAYYKEMQRREALYNEAVSDEPAVSDPLAHTARPTPRPDPGEDPETLANARGNLTVDSIAAVTGTGSGDKRDETRNIRVVGPVFLPGSDKKLDFTANTDRIEDIFR